MDKAKYLGVMIREKLDWNSHIKSQRDALSSSKQTLAIAHMNLYSFLVRSQLEYACINMKGIKMIQISILADDLTLILEDLKSMENSLNTK